MVRLILVSLVLLLPNTIIAFGCERGGPHKQDFKQAKTIFIGEAISVGTNRLINPKITDRALHSITFKVEKIWKGRKKNEITIFTDSCASMCCLVKFEEGGKYLVYVYEDSFVPSDCAVSAELGTDRAERNLKDINSFWFRLKARLWPL